MTRPFEQYEKIIAAYRAALDDRDPLTVDIFDLVSAIYAAVPGVTDEQIIAALEWSARQNEPEPETDALEKFLRAENMPGKRKRT